MVMPLDAITVFHNAFRRDLTEIDEAVYKAAANGGDLSPLIDRLQWFTEILDLHAQGEEEVVFPAVNKVAPLVAPLFVTDHREMDIMCADWSRWWVHRMNWPPHGPQPSYTPICESIWPRRTAISTRYFGNA